MCIQCCASYCYIMHMYFIAWCCQANVTTILHAVYTQTDRTSNHCHDKWSSSVSVISHLQDYYESLMVIIYCICRVSCMHMQARWKRSGWSGFGQTNFQLQGRYCTTCGQLSRSSKNAASWWLGTAHEELRKTAQWSCLTKPHEVGRSRVIS